VFAGLDEIDWCAMEHAYGPATEVPELLRGLISESPAEREVALDGMYGAVHHQGDVYECTVAAIPFLIEIVARPDLPGRHDVLGLLASIGCAGDERDGDGDDDDVAAEELGRYRLANHTVAAAYPTLLELLTDPDPAVRRTTPTALLACRPQAPQVASALLGRLPIEDDPEAREALAKTLGTLARSAASGDLPGVDPRRITSRLLAVVNGTGDAALRLTALAEVARCASAELPSDLVPTVLTLLDQVYVAHAPVPQPAGFSTDTRLGAIRTRCEHETAGRSAPHAGPLLGEISRALAHRVGERIDLLVALLHAPDWERRYDAIRPAQALIDGWRGEYEELVFLIGQQLLDPQPRLCGTAARVVRDLDDLAAPAADALATALEAAPRQAPGSRDEGLPAWILTWQASAPPTTGPVLRALAALGDPRALPALHWSLEHADLPQDLGFAIGGLGPAAGELVPLIRKRLGDLPTPIGYDMRRYGLVTALSRIGPAGSAALPELLTLLTASAKPAPLLLEVLGRFGPSAQEAVTALRPLLTHPDPQTALDVAHALWRIEADADAVLPVFARHLAGDRYRASRAAEGLAALGPAAAAQVPLLQELLEQPDPHGWVQVAATHALWRITEDTQVQGALTVLHRVWIANPPTRAKIAGILEHLGPPAAPALPLLQEELRAVRRHNARDNGGSSDQVAVDQRLLAACTTAITAITAA